MSLYEVHLLVNCANFLVYHTLSLMYTVSVERHFIEFMPLGSFKLSYCSWNYLLIKVSIKMGSPIMYNRSAFQC